MSSTEFDVMIDIHSASLSFLDRTYQASTLRDYFVTKLTSRWTETRRFSALKEVTFTACRGERVAVIGRNGSGKSTLCNTIARHYRPQTGRVEIKGRVRLVSDFAAGIFPELTGRENAQLLANLIYSGSRAEKRSLAEEAARFSELGPHLDRPFKTYSLGMRARLYLSVISARAPDILIFDETFDGTDTFFKEKMRERLVRVINQTPVVVMVSHSFEHLRHWCQRGVLMSEGEIAFDGPLEDGIGAYVNANHSVEARDLI